MVQHVKHVPPDMHVPVAHSHTTAVSRDVIIVRAEHITHQLVSHRVQPVPLAITAQAEQTARHVRLTQPVRRGPMQSATVSARRDLAATPGHLAVHVRHVHVVLTRPAMVIHHVQKRLMVIMQPAPGTQGRPRQRRVIMQRPVHAARPHVQDVLSILRRGLRHVRLYQRDITQPGATAAVMHVPVKQFVPRARTAAVVFQTIARRVNTAQPQV